MITKVRLLTASAFFLALTIPLVYTHARSLWYPLYLDIVGRRTVQTVIDELGPTAEARLAPRFAAAGVTYPPRRVTLLGLKAEKTLELWAGNNDHWTLIHRYPIEAASGVAGPKLREGDRQVPEGIYRVVGLNPNSSYHLSLKLDYPNAFDLAKAEREGRDDPGSNIFIHGKARSIGCLAMGDPAIEELFVLAQRVGKENIQVLIAPFDGRVRGFFPVPRHLPAWTGDLYTRLERALRPFRGNPPDSE